ncbi:MAG: SDR family oxidoreductase [Candidatus Obscuribacterales bacterium]|nr:SDR family oxidoreductase [Cyanobacteria bacterium SZAS LIN-5]
MPKNKLKPGFAGVITGASTGIGKALAILLADRLQAKLIINARTEEALAETHACVRKHGGEAIIAPGDVAAAGMPAALVDRCLKEFGKIDLLVNNAGLAKPGAVMNLTPQDWERVFAVNFFAPLHATYAALPHFVSQKAGKVVNISSVAGKVAFPGSVCYAASKFALTGMSEGMAAELQNQGVDFITVCPGWVRTEFFDKNDVMKSKNPTLIAQEGNLRGMVMKHILSISSERAAEDIFQALQKGGGQEIVLTAPGIAVERLNALFPRAIFGMSKRIPTEFVDSSNRSKK